MSSRVAWQGPGGFGGVPPEPVCIFLRPWRRCQVLTVSSARVFHQLGVRADSALVLCANLVTWVGGSAPHPPLLCDLEAGLGLRSHGHLPARPPAPFPWGSAPGLSPD